MSKVALSGAEGQLGQFLRPRLLAQGVDLRSAGLHVLEPLGTGEDLTHGDLRDSENVDRLLRGVDVLIHMAGTSVERPLPEIIDNNLVGLHAVYEGRGASLVTAHDARTWTDVPLCAAAVK